MRRLIPLTLVMVITACEYQRKRMDPTARPLTQCEWVASSSSNAKNDREAFRRLRSPGEVDSEEFWRDTFLRDRPVASTKFRCVEDDEGLHLTILEKVLHP